MGHIATAALAALILCGTTATFSCVRMAQKTSAGGGLKAPERMTVESAGISPVHINTASVGELRRLPGVGQSLAARIVAHRERYGPFRRAEHLIIVRGFSERRFRAIRALVTVD